MLRLKEIKSVEWVGDDEDEQNSYCGLRITDVEGNAVELPLYRGRDNEYSNVLMNIYMNAVLRQNGVQCSCWYPYDLESPYGLVNDVRRMLDLKQNGNPELFEYTYSKKDFVNRNWVDITRSIRNKLLGIKRKRRIQEEDS